MDITYIQSCADYYEENFLNTYYIITTYNNRSFILVGEKMNFPHLMGISKMVYRSNGYRTPQALYRAIYSRAPVNSRVIPKHIATTSKMYKKALNFQNCTDIFWKNKGPLAVSFNPALSATYLNNVDILIADIKSGYMLGWVSNKKVSINEQICIEKHCISTWIDESNGYVTKREKYMPHQDFELLRYVLAFDKDSKLIRHKHYKYSLTDKIHTLEMSARNHANFLVDRNNERFY